MLATTLGIEFDVNAAWSEREQTYKASGNIISKPRMSASLLKETKMVSGQRQSPWQYSCNGLIN